MIIWLRINYLAQRMMQPLDVGLKWQAIAVCILLDTSCYSPMSGDNISPWSLLEPFVEKCLLHPNFLCALSQNLLSTSLCFDFSRCGLTLCHS